MEKMGVYLFSERGFLAYFGTLFRVFIHAARATRPGAYLGVARKKPKRMHGVPIRQVQHSAMDKDNVQMQADFLMFGLRGVARRCGR